MTEINFKGKDFVYDHHLAIPHRPLVVDAKKSIGAPDLDGNLIIQGDNLHALKSLMPYYGSKIDCIFIDPPYNTGKEESKDKNGTKRKGWIYSDNVDAPQITEWLAANPITTDDLLRHDKWCAMMWPRLKLLHELLSETGSFWMTLDDNEVHRAKLMLDEIFGEDAFISEIIWRKKAGGGQDSENLAREHDYLLVYKKSNFTVTHEEKMQEESDFNKILDKRKCRFVKLEKWGAGSYKEDAKTLHYPIIDPAGNEYFPIAPDGRPGRWRKKPESLDEKHLQWCKTKNKGLVPYEVIYFDEVRDIPKAIKERSIFYDVANTTQAAKEIKAIFGKKIFDTPKPLRLLKRILELALPEDGIILDSFAGSATTAHAVLDANERDGCNRKFILVEMEHHIADAVTAERVRRVIKGYKCEGTQKTELLNKKLNWSTLQKGDSLVAKVESIEALQGKNYDKISKQVKDDTLIITGEKKIKDKTEGLGGSFTYCTLGAALELDNLLTGKDLPSYKDIAPVLFRIVTNESMKKGSMRQKDSYLGETETAHVWLIYKSDIEWLKSPAADLNLSRTKEIAKYDTKKEHFVIAVADAVGRDVLRRDNLTQVRHVPLPYALFYNTKTKS